MKLLAELDDPKRAPELRKRIKDKPFLRKFYEEVYCRYSENIRRAPPGGLVLELGSGAGFSKEFIPDIVTSDVLAYEGIDQVVDATKMPFEDNTLRAIVMMNVFHHIPDVGAFLKEAQRCLKPGGRLYIFDQNIGWISKPILKHFHHEPFHPEVKEWKFESSGPLSSANGALAWIVFKRDFQKFSELYPKLALQRFEPHSPLRYWVSGGLKNWCLVPGSLFKAATWFDQALTKLSPKFGSFVDIEIEKKAP